MKTNYQIEERGTLKEVEFDDFFKNILYSFRQTTAAFENKLRLEAKKDLAAFGEKKEYYDMILSKFELAYAKVYHSASDLSIVLLLNKVFNELNEQGEFYHLYEKAKALKVDVEKKLYENLKNFDKLLDEHGKDIFTAATIDEEANLLKIPTLENIDKKTPVYPIGSLKGILMRKLNNYVTNELEAKTNLIHEKTNLEPPLQAKILAIYEPNKIKSYEHFKRKDYNELITDKKSLNEIDKISQEYYNNHRLAERLEEVYRYLKNISLDEEKILKLHEIINSNWFFDKKCEQLILAILNAYLKTANKNQNSLKKEKVDLEKELSIDEYLDNKIAAEIEIIEPLFPEKENQKKLV